MKTIKQGKKFLDKPWIGKKVSCRDCKGRFQLELGDKVKENGDQRDGDFYSVKCPNCKSEIIWSM